MYITQYIKSTTRFLPNNRVGRASFWYFFGSSENFPSHRLFHAKTTAITVGPSAIWFNTTWKQVKFQDFDYKVLNFLAFEELKVIHTLADKFSNVGLGIQRSRNWYHAYEPGPYNRKPYVVIRRARSQSCLERRAAIISWCSICGKTSKSESPISYKKLKL